jgi:hypothetical protein
VLGQDLHRHLPPQARVPRAVDLAHAPRAEERHDLVGTEAAPTGEGELLGRLLRQGLFQQPLGFFLVAEEGLHLMEERFVVAAGFLEKGVAPVGALGERKVIELLDSVEVPGLAHGRPITPREPATSESFRKRSRRATRLSRRPLLRDVRPELAM